MKKILLIVSMVWVLFLTGCKINEEKILDSEFAEGYISIINQMEAESFNTDFKYSLVYFNNDEVPELVVDLPDYWLTVYTYKDGKTINMAEDNGRFAYGTGGLTGYSYASKKGVMTSSSHDNERYGYTSYYELNENGSLVNSYTIQTIIFSENENEIGKQTEIGELLYTNLDECKFEALSGTKSSIEMMAEIKEKM